MTISDAADEELVAVESDMVAGRGKDEGAHREAPAMTIARITSGPMMPAYYNHRHACQGQI